MLKYFFFSFFTSLSISFLLAEEAIFPNPNPDNIGECVYYYQCDNNGYIKTNGSLIVGPRVDLNTTDHTPIPCPCKEAAFVCCKPPTQIKRKFGEPIMPTKHCGEKKTILGPRISSTDDTNLYVAESSEYPWTLALFKVKPTDAEDLIFLSGASLLGPRVAVTVNHNFPRLVRPQSYVVRAGEFDLTNTDEIIKHQDRVLTKIIKHPQYNSNGLLYDIALIIWDKPFDMSYANTNSICLPEADDNFEDLDCYVTGWGTSVLSTSARISDQLKFLELTVVGKADCENLYKKTALGNGFQLHESFLCAGGEAGRDTCKGDGGSPLVCKQHTERYFKLAGLVSWAIGCGEPRPSIYTNIANTVEWIRKELNNNNVEEFIHN